MAKAKKRKSKKAASKRSAKPRAKPVTLRVKATKLGNVPNRADWYVYNVAVDGPCGTLKLANVVAKNQTDAERAGRRIFRQSV